MQRSLSSLLDRISNYLAHRKGLLPMIGIILIIINLILQFIPGAGVLAQKNILLHLGLITAFLGLMLAWIL